MLFLLVDWNKLNHLSRGRNENLMSKSVPISVTWAGQRVSEKITKQHMEKIHCFSIGWCGGLRKNAWIYSFVLRLLLCKKTEPGKHRNSKYIQKVRYIEFDRVRNFVAEYPESHYFLRNSAALSMCDHEYSSVHLSCDGACMI